MEENEPQYEVTAEDCFVIGIVFGAIAVLLTYAEDMVVGVWIFTIAAALFGLGGIFCLYLDHKSIKPEDPKDEL